MYTLIIDGTVKSATGRLGNLKDALYWYNYARDNGASSAALWCKNKLVQYFIRGENNE